MSDTIKTRAAVAFAPNEPLKVVEVDLQRPKAGEVLIEIMATGICHTDAYTLDGLDSEGLFPCILGHEGAGIVREIGEGVKFREDAPFDKSCYIGCGVTTGVGAVTKTAKVEPGANVIVFGLGGIGLNVLQAARMVGADKIIGVDINDDKKEWGERFGMTHFVNPKKVEGDLVAHLVELTDGGADYTFDCTGNTNVMRDALEACHRGWGVSVVIGVAEAGKEISTRPFQLVTGRVWKGTAFGGAKGRTDVPKIVDWYMNGKIEIDPMITHVLKLDEINKAFDLMHAGESIRSVVVY